MPRYVELEENAVVLVLTPINGGVNMGIRTNIGPNFPNPLQLIYLANGLMRAVQTDSEGLIQDGRAYAMREAAMYAGHNPVPQPKPSVSKFKPLHYDTEVHGTA